MHCLFKMLFVDDDFRTCAGGEKRCFAHQFSYEGPSGVFGASDERFEVVYLKLKSLTVQLKKLSPAVRVGQWDFERLVDPPWACGQRRFEDVGAIGCQ